MILGVLALFLFTPMMMPLGIRDAFTRLRQRFSYTQTYHHHDDEFYAPDIAAMTPSEGILRSLRTDTVQPSHVARGVTFENNIPEYLALLKSDPEYADLENLIDPTIIVNGKAVAPGSCETIAIEDDQCLVTIRLHKGMAKLIYAMNHGALRGVLVQLLKRMERWTQWQYTLVCHIGTGLDRIQLSNIILEAYSKAKDSRSVNQRFKWILVVELSLNEKIDI